MGKKSNALGRGLGTIIQDHEVNIEQVITKDENGEALKISKISCFTNSMLYFWVFTFAIR